LSGKPSLALDNDSSAPALQNFPDEPTFQPLFNGKDLTGWISTDRLDGERPGPAVQQGRPNAFLRTEKAYENYALAADPKLHPSLTP
jgi:hypothetical protein